MSKRVGRKTAGIAGAAIVAVAALGAATRGAPSEAMQDQAAVATVNGVALTRAALDASMATARRPHTEAAQHEYKQRLIACELLRQAAMKAKRKKSTPAPEAPLAISPSGGLVCASPEIRPYLLDAVRTASVTDAELRARYATLAGAEAAPPAEQGKRTCPRQADFSQVSACLRSGMEAERLDVAIRALADRLIDEADIRQ